MSDEMKRLLKCDFRYSAQNLGGIAVAVIALILWFWFLFGTIVDMYLLIFMFMGIIMLTMSIADWQYRNSLYVSMGMPRKHVYRIIAGRGILWMIVSLLAEAVVGVVFYPGKFNTGFLFLSVGYYLFCHGFGQFAGTLIYQKKKIGTVLEVIGLMTVCMVGGFAVVMSLETDLPNIVDVIHMTHVIIVSVLAICMWGFGMYQVHKQMKDFAVA